jgi:CubicO group peptidase (beta-lactamase class C family)
LYQDFVRERIFTPLGMAESGFEPDPAGPEAAQGYRSFTVVDPEPCAERGLELHVFGWFNLYDAGRYGEMGRCLDEREDTKARIVPAPDYEPISQQRSSDKLLLRSREKGSKRGNYFLA